ERAADTWDRLEKVVETRVQKALVGLGVPARDDLRELSERVDRLTAELQRQRGGAAKSGAAGKATKKATGKAAKKTAKAPSKSAAARKAPARKAPPGRSAKKAASKKTAAAQGRRRRRRALVLLPRGSVRVGWCPGPSPWRRVALRNHPHPTLPLKGRALMSRLL